MAFDPTMRTLVLNPDQSKLVDVKSVETRGVKGFRSRACAMVLNEIEATAVSYGDKTWSEILGKLLSVVRSEAAGDRTTSNAMGDIDVFQFMEIVAIKARYEGSRYGGIPLTSAFAYAGAEVHSVIWRHVSRL